MNNKDKRKSTNVVNVTTTNDVIATRIVVEAIVGDIVAVLDRPTAHGTIGVIEVIEVIEVIVVIGIVAVEEIMITAVKKTEGK